MQSSKDGLRPAAGNDFSGSRRSILKWSSGALLGVLAYGGGIPGLTLNDAFAQGAGGAAVNGSDAVDLGKGDIAVLNYALALEQLEAAFYTQAVKTSYQGMDSQARDYLTAIRDQEIIHREFLKAALGSHAIPDLQVDFTKVDFGSKTSVLQTAETFENLGVGAYNGAGKLLKNAEYLLLAGKIVSVEARHAAAIGYLIGHSESATVGSNSSGSGNNTSGSNDNRQDASNQNSNNQSNNDQNGNNQNGNAQSSSNQNVSIIGRGAVNDKGLDEALAPSDVLPKAAPFIKTKINASGLT